jgi:ABC-type Mn2+/Zn2+ transport system ATPase subunit
VAVRAAGLVTVHGRGPDAVRALDHVDLDLHAGRFTTVMGPSGSGKSTLLQTLVGLLEPLGGTVTSAGREVDERRADFRRDVACVLDDDFRHRIGIDREDRSDVTGRRNRIRRLLDGLRASVGPFLARQARLQALQALRARSLELSGEEARRMLDGRGGARLRWDGTHLVGEVLPE